MITVSPKGSTVEQLSLGNKYSTLRVDDENFNAYIDITSDDRFIESRVDYNNRVVLFTLQSENVSYNFSENNISVAGISFNKNGISVTSNGGEVLKFTDKTNTLNVISVTFTVAELIALKALLQTT